MWHLHPYLYLNTHIVYALMYQNIHNQPSSSSSSNDNNLLFLTAFTADFFFFASFFTSFSLDARFSGFLNIGLSFLLSQQSLETRNTVQKLTYTKLSYLVQNVYSYSPHLCLNSLGVKY